MSTSTDEHRALLAEVDRFAVRVVDPSVARPEAPMRAEALAEVLAGAEALGLAGADEEPTGLAPWEALGAGGCFGATLALLTRLARSNTAVGLVVHERALARAVARRAGLQGIVVGSLAIAPQGHHGLGRGALVRALSGALLEADDRALLADTYGHEATRVLPLDPAFAGLLTPCANTDGALGWQLHSRAQLDVTVHPNAHGLDELVTAEVRPRERGTIAVMAPDAARSLVGEAILAHQLGLVALALGAVERAHQLAKAFAAHRHQGGATIDRHSAVLGLLGRASTTLRSCRTALEALDARPLSVAELPGALALRARALPALADAANGAQQVFGGLGYMKETGAEKIVRDVNCLRALAGSARELTLMVAEWERLHD
jgi:alkylation response protein AidB-like acyl-CoA dehydrogenase